MESFYRSWLDKNKNENQKAQEILNRSQGTSSNLSNNISVAPALTRDTSSITSNSEPTTSSNTSRTRDNSLIAPTPSTSRPSLPSLSERDNAPTPTPSTSRSNVPRDQSATEFVYENDQLQLFIVKANHIRQKKFRLEDHMFHMKINLKSGVEPPLLRDILNFLEIGFNHILTNIKSFYKPEDHNIAFLTLYQEPMINGLNTGGFDIQESALEMVERVLKMLEQFLVSNQTLHLDDSFKVYLKILSIEHLKFKANSKPRIQQKRTHQFYKKHFGAYNEILKRYNFFWALDVPDSFPKEPILNIFKNKCLLTTTILGLLQHQYFESKRLDKRFIHVQNINSKNFEKRNHAGRILAHELEKLINETGIPSEGPHELETTVQKLSEFYHCQFFIFDNIFNSNKLNFMYPPEYDNSLKPIYLFQPNDAKNHLVFIRNLNSYFKANVKVCFGCRKIFSTHNYRHLCPKSKCCFSCRRFFQSESTYMHEKLSQYFCDKNLTTENSFICRICNVTCYSKHCFNGHKFFCYGKGLFGYKCLKCKKFTYRYGKKSTEFLKRTHLCGEHKRCLYCRETKLNDHLCKLSKETVNPNSSRLAFIGMEFYKSTSEKCIDCSEMKNVQNLNSQSECGHVNNDPLLVLIYREEKYRGNFTKYEFQNFEEKPQLFKTENILTIPYDDISFNTNKEKETKKSQDFKTNSEKLQNSEPTLLSTLLLQVLTSPDWQNTTFICQDSSSIIYVSFPKTNTILSKASLRHQQKGCDSQIEIY